MSISNDVLADKEQKRREFAKELAKVLDELQQQVYKRRIKRYLKQIEEAEKEPDISLEELLRRNIGEN